MATLSSGNTLSLNNLTALDNGTKDIRYNWRWNKYTYFNVKTIDAVGSLSGFTYVVENTSENYTLGFTNEGGRFDKIKNLKRNFDWSVTKNGGGTSLFTSKSYSQV